MAKEFIYLPNFLRYDGESSFDDVWEAFCCKLLNLEYITNDIYRRTPPESGVDLHYKNINTAYQCKSVISGQASGFNTTHAKKSFDDALSVQAELGWKEYVICTNVDLTGPKLTTLTSYSPLIKVYGKSYWDRLCQKHTSNILDNFNEVIKVPGNDIIEMDSRYVLEQYSEEQKKMLIADSSVLLYWRGVNKIIKFPIFEGMFVYELLNIISRYFKIPVNTKIKIDDSLYTEVNNYIYNGSTRVLSTQKIEEINNLGVLTCWTDVKIISVGAERRDYVMNMMVAGQEMETNKPNRNVEAEKIVLGVLLDQYSEAFLNVGKDF